MLRRKDRRARIRIGPGGLIYLLITILILAAAIYTQANLLFWAFGLMIGGLFVSVLFAWQTLRQVEVQRLLPSHGVAGEPLAIRYQVTNRSRLPVFSLIIHETWGRGWRSWRKTGPIAARPQQLAGRPYGWALHLGPRQTVQAEAPCWPLRRGRLHFEWIVLSSGFPFGVLRKVVRLYQPDAVLIYPHLYRINRRLVFRLSRFDPSGRKHRERGGGTEEFFGLRAYRHGDSLKLIDWKRSARTGELVSREFTQPSPPQVMILLDVRTPDHTPQAPSTASRKRRWWQIPGITSRREPVDDHADKALVESALSLVASLVCEAHFHGCQIGLSVAGVDVPAIPPHHSLPHRTRILEALAHLDATHRDQEIRAVPGTDPSVVVRLGRGEEMLPRGPGGRPLTLGAMDMDRYVQEAEDAGAMLTRAVRPMTRRHQAAEEAAEPIVSR